MKLGDPPTLPRYLREDFTYNQRVQDAVKARIEASEAQRKLPDISKLTRIQQTFIKRTTVARLPDPELQRIYINAIDETRQVLTRPDVTDLEFDLHAALDQPELTSALGDWQHPIPSRGPRPNTAGAKALMTLVSLGQSSHVRSARITFHTQPGLQQVFAHHERQHAQRAGREAQRFQIRDYSVCLDQIRGLCSTGFDRRLLQANIEMLQALRVMYPKRGICEIAAIDGTDVAAWCVQAGARDFDDETFIRRRTPKAGPRWIPGDNEIIVDPNGEWVEVVGKGRFWRGYYLVVLVDVKTGLPIVWTLRNADWRESDALKELLFLLYELWPDCPLKIVIGDKAWDFAEYAKLCALNYGIHLVAIQKDSNRTKQRVLDIKTHKEIAGYRGDGTVVCRRHGTVMTFVGVEGIENRDGLAPGDENAASGCKARYRCDDCGSVRSLRMDLDWNVFPYYPHSPSGTNGASKRYAQRRALESRRNIAESTFSSLKTICQLALQGPRRTRLTDFDTVQTLIALSFTVRTAMALAGERIRSGGYPSHFPADLLDGREMRCR